jgi:hypothetical protein
MRVYARSKKKSWQEAANKLTQIHETIHLDWNYSSCFIHQHIEKRHKQSKQTIRTITRWIRMGIQRDQASAWQQSWVRNSHNFVSASTSLGMMPSCSLSTRHNLSGKSLQNSNAYAKQMSFRTAISETCQQQPVPRKELLVLGDCLHREGLSSLKSPEGKSPVIPCITWKHLLTMYCHEIATLTNAATPASSLASRLSWRKMQKCELCTYINHSFLKRLSGANVGIDCCSFSSLPVRSKLPTTTTASMCSKQEAYTKSSVLYEMMFSTIY